MTSPWRTLAAMTAGLSLLVVTVRLHPAPRLVWNPSPSAPIGLYEVLPHESLKRGAWVIVAPSQRLADFLAARGYLPRGVPLLKAIAALPGQRVCRAGLTIAVDGRAMALARRRDHLGRALPAWSGCVTLAQDQIFLLNAGVPDSLDGRYFGATKVRQVLGVAHPLWTRARP